MPLHQDLGLLAATSFFLAKRFLTKPADVITPLAREV
jgi:hypothetical protein